MPVYINNQWFFYDRETKVYVGGCTIEYDRSKHQVMSQGTTLTEARLALESAITLTVKNWHTK